MLLCDKIYGNATYSRNKKGHTAAAAAPFSGRSLRDLNLTQRTQRNGRSAYSPPLVSLQRAHARTHTHTHTSPVSNCMQPRGYCLERAREAPRRSSHRLVDDVVEVVRACEARACAAAGGGCDDCESGDGCCWRGLSDVIAAE